MKVIITLLAFMVFVSFCYLAKRINALIINIDNLLLEIRKANIDSDNSISMRILNEKLTDLEHKINRHGKEK